MNAYFHLTFPGTDALTRLYIWDVLEVSRSAIMNLLELNKFNNLSTRIFESKGFPWE